MALSDLDPAERHRRIAGGFTDRVRGVRDWDAPPPVAAWAARDVGGHLVGWLPPFVAPGAAGAPRAGVAPLVDGLPPFVASGAGVQLPVGPAVRDDPAGAWQAHCAGVQAVLDDPGTPHRVFTNPHIGELPLDQAIDRF